MPTPTSLGAPGASAATRQAAGYTTGHVTAGIAATATALPDYTLTRDDAKKYIQGVFDLDDRRTDMMLAIIDNALVEKRHSIFPVDYLIEQRSLTQTTLEYQEHSVRLGKEVAARCLENGGFSPADVDLIITVSCTGFMIPSLDAHLINLMGFRSDVRRLPLTELGCAAGAMALARAFDYVKAYPTSTVLIVSVELPSLTFQRGDLSQANLISCILFGDGAAAALITGRPVNGPRLLAAETYTFPESLDAMGFALRDSGFHILLSKDVPQMIREKIGPLVDAFLGSRGLTRASMSAFLLHPGGQKLLSYVQEELGLSRLDTELSWNVLGEYGNLSSATILFILHAWLLKNTMRSGDLALAAAFGPGFSAELLLLQWT